MTQEGKTPPDGERAPAGTGGAALRATRLGRAWRAWAEWMDRREAPTALALTRLLVAAAVLGDLLQAAYLGVVSAVWSPPPHGIGTGAAWTRELPFMVEWLGASSQTAWVVWTAAAVSAALFLVGAATRVSAVALVLALAQLGHIAPNGDRGIDFFLRSVILVLALSGCHARWSVDAWVRRKIGRPMPAEVPAWPRYLLFAQLVWLYFSAGHNKSDPSWGPQGGLDALPSILCDPHFARFECNWVGYAYPLLQLGTLATMVFELSSVLLPILTWWSRAPERAGRIGRISNWLRLRWAWIATGVFFHLAIAVTMRLGMFPFGCLAVYPVLFHPDEIGRAAGWLKRRVLRRATAAAAAVAAIAFVLALAAGCGGGESAGPAAPAPAPQTHEQQHEHAGGGEHPHDHACGHGQHRFENAEEWARHFDDPSRASWQRPDEVVALLQLEPGMTAVDLGAGTGYFLARLSRAVGPKGRVVATDIEPDMVRYMKERAAREGLGNVEVVLAPADDVGVPPGSADRVLIVDVWHHIANREAYASKLARALRPGGAVLIIDFTLESERGPPRQHRLAPEKVVAELQAGGLDAEIAPEALPDQYAVRARRGKDAPLSRLPRIRADELSTCCTATAAGHGSASARAGAGGCGKVCPDRSPGSPRARQASDVPLATAEHFPGDAASLALSRVSSGRSPSSNARSSQGWMARQGMGSSGTAPTRDW